MLKDQELLQICRSYEITCAFCATKNQFYRFKRDMVRPVKTEGDGHPLSWKWAKSGFEKIDPKQFFLSVCNTCGYTGEVDDAGFRKSGDAPDVYKKDFSSEAVMAFVRGSSIGKGIAQSLINTIDSEAPFGSAISKFHLAVYSHTLRNRIIPGSIARYYLRLAWLFRHKNIFSGKEFMPVNITTQMVGHYLGEYVITNKRVNHGAPGVGASRSSLYVPLK